MRVNSPSYFEKFEKTTLLNTMIECNDESEEQEYIDLVTQLHDELLKLKNKMELFISMHIE